MKWGEGKKIAPLQNHYTHAHDIFTNTQIKTQTYMSIFWSDTKPNHIQTPLLYSTNRPDNAKTSGFSACTLKKKVCITNFSLYQHLNSFFFLSHCLTHTLYLWFEFEFGFTLHTCVISHIVFFFLLASLVFPRSIFFTSFTCLELIWFFLRRIELLFYFMSTKVSSHIIFSIVHVHVLCFASPRTNCACIRWCVYRINGTDPRARIKRIYYIVPDLECLVALLIFTSNIDNSLSTFIWTIYSKR